MLCAGMWPSFVALVGALLFWPTSSSQLGGGTWTTCLIVSDEVLCYGAFEFHMPGRFTSISVAGWGSQIEQAVCGIKDDESLACVSYKSPLNPPSGHYSTIPCARNFCCALRKPLLDIACFGYTAADVQFDVALPRGSFAQLAMGSAHGCALNATGHAFCFGFANSYAPNLFSATPRQSQFRLLAPGSAWTCGILLSGQLRCWGNNHFANPPAGEFALLAAGSLFSCAQRITPSVDMECWPPSAPAPAPRISFAQLAHGCDNHMW